MILNSSTLGVIRVVQASIGLAEGLVPCPTVQTGRESAHQIGRYDVSKSTFPLPRYAITTDPSTTYLDDDNVVIQTTLPSTAKPSVTIVHLQVPEFRRIRRRRHANATPRCKAYDAIYMAFSYTSRGSAKCRTESLERLFKAQFTLKNNCFR
jgi:hypothetical protein